MIFHELFCKAEYREIALPEAEVRGGDVTCQIALKPFNNRQLRSDFREIMVKRIVALGMDIDVFIGGRTTIDIQRSGVNKRKAIEYAMERLDLDPLTTVYFGDEFVAYGNDVPAASLPDDRRPSLIIHVGDIGNTPDNIKDKLTLDGNGPAGTLNHLKTIDKTIDLELSRQAVV